MIQSFHLPALPHLSTTTWSYGRGKARVDLRIPQLTPALLRSQTEALLEAQERHLVSRPVREIVEVIGRVAARLADPADPLRQTAEAALPVVTGYSAPMITQVLDTMTADWSVDRLWELLREEFGDPTVLDTFRPRPAARGQTRAFGPRLATHIFSGNVPGVAVTSIIRSLLVKSATLGKTAAGEPLLPALFAQGLAEVDAELGACVAVTYWPGGDEALERVALSPAEVVVVYGENDTVAAVRTRAPAKARFLGYGHKLSFGVIGREALSAEQSASAAARAALEVATFDQQGCVSPHLFYVEEGGDTAPAEWALQLAAAMADAECTLPRGALSPREATAIRQLRGEAEFAQIGGRGVELHTSAEGTAWTVIYDPDPAFCASCLNRVVRVKPVPRLESVPALVASIGSFLQTVGVAAESARVLWLASALGRLGASRIAPLGQMAWPPPSWHHDGHPPLRGMVRWCDVETS
ncbi:MAG: acyl-CoA reductase [Gemmatimonadetes bacterium]|nr:acyl-CoA reductase [Gemmatimonadota bacterium]